LKGKGVSWFYFSFFENTKKKKSNKRKKVLAHAVSRFIAQREKHGFKKITT
jgi:hypothetical protein